MAIIIISQKIFSQDFLLGEEIGNVYNRDRLKELVRVSKKSSELGKKFILEFDKLFRLTRLFAIKSIIFFVKLRWKIILKIINVLLCTIIR